MTIPTPESAADQAWTLTHHATAKALLHNISVDDARNAAAHPEAIIPSVQHPGRQVRRAGQVEVLVDEPARQIIAVMPRASGTLSHRIQPRHRQTLHTHYRIEQGKSDDGQAHTGREG